MISINGHEYYGTLSAGEHYDMVLQLEDTGGLSVGEPVEIAEDGAEYYGRVICAIDGGTVYLDSNDVYQRDRQAEAESDIWDAICDIELQL